ncbi:transposase [Kocuria subflava]|uniref:Transposase n=1 Tax=Kocuria subflava TaxID=1736139 RepID=A0A846TZ77_9MICC|nr:transposase [Kocuria subflava]
MTAGVTASVGTVGDSYDNALAETVNGLYKAELIRNKGPWAGISDVEIAVAEWVEWYNHRRLHGELGYLPPAEYETNHSANHHQASSPELATHGSLHETRGDTAATPVVGQ